MEKKSIHSKAAGVLRRVLSNQQPAQTPEVEEPKPAEPAQSAQPADETTK